MNEDKRFAHITTDPKFRRIPKSERKIKIDKRFQSMFNDKQFKIKYTVDKRGRPVNQSSTEDLKRYYDLSSDSSSSDDDAEKSDKDDDDDINKVVPDATTLPKKIRAKLRNLNVDYARGESTLYSGSSSSSSDNDDDDDNEEGAADAAGIDHKWGELDTDATQTEDATARLAACNMNWDRIRAVDLMVLFNSFLPPGGVIQSVTIYPSDFGRARMLEEEIRGPTELLLNNNNHEETNDTEEGAKFHMEKLRQYQLNRLKYYYAVIVFDSVNSASRIYSECDGMEYESSATKIDLRFIPDDMDFDEDQIKEKSLKLPELDKYQPRFFTTTALQQAKVDLTWDETDLERVEIAQKLSSGKVDDLTENDLGSYLALNSSSSEDDDGKNNDSSSNSDDNEDDNSTTTTTKKSLDKYKALLRDIEDKEQEKRDKDVEMEVTWGINLKNKTEDLVKKKLSKQEQDEKTPFQQYLAKRKEKRKDKKLTKLKQRNESVTSDVDDEDSVPSDVDLNDPYFADEFNNGEFNNKKRKNKSKNSDNNDDDENEGKRAELELLLGDDDDDGKCHFSLKNIQKRELVVGNKANKKQRLESTINDDDFQVNVNDDRFSALFTSHHFNIDPTDPHYKKTKAMETLISEKIKRRNNNDDDVRKKKLTTNEVVAGDRNAAELSVLVKSVKRKAKQALNKKIIKTKNVSKVHSG